MVAGKNSFTRVCFEYYNLAVPTVEAHCEEDDNTQQQVDALVYPWQRLCIPYGRLFELSVVDTETQFSVCLQSRHRSPFPLHQLGLGLGFVRTQLVF